MKCTQNGAWHIVGVEYIFSEWMKNTTIKWTKIQNKSLTPVQAPSITLSPKKNLSPLKYTPRALT